MAPNGAKINSANLTPDAETGIGNWSEEAFINRFRSYANLRNSPNLGPDGPFTAMPWAEYADMKDDDLRAIYRYLKTLPPVKKNDTPYYTPPKTAEL